MHDHGKMDILSIPPINAEDVCLIKEWLQEDFKRIEPERQQIFLILRKVCEPKNPFKHPLNANDELNFKRKVHKVVKIIYDLNQKILISGNVSYQWEYFLQELVDRSLEEYEDFFNSVWFLFHNLSLSCSQGRDLQCLLSCFRDIMDSLYLGEAAFINNCVRWFKLVLVFSGDRNDSIFKSMLKWMEHFGSEVVLNTSKSFLDQSFVINDTYSESTKEKYFYFLTKMPKYRYMSIFYFFSKTAGDDLKADRLMGCMLELGEKDQVLLISRLYCLSKINIIETKKEIEMISEENSRLFFERIEVLYWRSLKIYQKIYLKKWSDFCVEKTKKICGERKCSVEDLFGVLNFLFLDDTENDNQSFYFYTCSDPNSCSDMVFARYSNVIPELYGILFWQASIAVSQVIRQLIAKGNINFQCVLNCLSISRQGIENVFLGEDSVDDGVNVNRCGQYRFNKTKNFLEDGTSFFTVHSEFLRTPFLFYLDKNNRVFGVPDLEPASVTLVEHPNKKGERIKLTEVFFSNSYNEFYHFSDEKNYDDVMLHLEKLFQLSLEPQESLDKLLEHLGRLHWWLSHACLFKKGSASISEMLIATILLHHGWLHSFWKKDIAIDVVALCCASEDDFIKKYYNKNFLRHEIQRLDVSIGLANIRERL